MTGIENVLGKDLLGQTNDNGNGETQGETEIKDPELELLNQKLTKQDQINESESKRNADILVKLAENNCVEFFKDEYGSTFAVIKTQDHKEVISLENSKFKQWLSKLFYDSNGKKVAGSDAVNSAIQVLQAKASFEGRTIPLPLRVSSSRDKNTIYYDLTDEKWRTVKISNEGWSIVTDGEPLFNRFNQTKQVQPSRSYDPNIFEEFLDLANVKGKDQRLLLKVCIISMFVPDIPRVILVLHGEKGSAKSTLQSLIKKIVDPSKPTLLTMNRDKNEFIQQAAHNHLLCFDNTEDISKWISAEICKASTGVGMTKRRLYTNDEDYVYEYKRCISINGINVNLTEADALERSLLIELERISRKDRKSESVILDQFEKMRPQLLGYIFDTLSKALQIKGIVKLNDSPRMADFAFWGEAISRAMEHEPFEFTTAYYKNIGKQNTEAIENNPLAQAIVKLVDDLGPETQEYYDSTSKCLVRLRQIAEVNDIKTDDNFPDRANVLSRKIREIKSNLLDGFDIEVQIGRATKEVKEKGIKLNTSTIKIRKIAPLPPVSPIDQNQSRNLDKFTGDIYDNAGIISPVDKIPPVSDCENHAHITKDVAKTGDSGDTGDNFRNFSESFDKSNDDILIKSNTATVQVQKQKETKTEVESEYKCYNHNCDFQTHDQKEYEEHGIMKHPGKPCYPGKADLDHYGWASQGKKWEKPVNRKEDVDRYLGKTG